MATTSEQKKPGPEFFPMPPSGVDLSNQDAIGELWRKALEPFQLWHVMDVTSFELPQILHLDRERKD